LNEYCTENKIERKSKKERMTPEEKRNIILRKLALYFNKNETDFE